VVAAAVQGANSFFRGELEKKIKEKMDPKM